MNNTPPETLLQKLEKAARLRGLEKNSKESLEWFRKNARYAAGREQAQTLLQKQQKSKIKKFASGKSGIGKMFTYAYDAKHKDTLPYWDRFPLIFYIGPAESGFYGINLHYLPPKARAMLFDALLEIQNSARIAENKKLRVTYDLLKSSQKFRLFKPCFKRYLSSHLQSRIVEIPATEWEAALFLPIADFTGASMTKIWSDSMLGIK